MSSTIIKLKYSIGEKIKIKEINRIGIIVGFYYGDTGKQYQVAYFDDGKRLREYFYELEISNIKESEIGHGFLNREKQ